MKLLFSHFFPMYAWILNGFFMSLYFDAPRLTDLFSMFMVDKVLFVYKKYISNILSMHKNSEFQGEELQHLTEAGKQRPHRLVCATAMESTAGPPRRLLVVESWRVFFSLLP